MNKDYITMWLLDPKEKYVCFEFSQPILFLNPDPKVAITGKRIYPKAAAISRMETLFSLTLFLILQQCFWFRTSSSLLFEF
jgi:hypothetical protein